MLTAVLEARFAPEVIDATQHDDVQTQNRFNLTLLLYTLPSAALLLEPRQDEQGGWLG